MFSLAALAMGGWRQRRSHVEQSADDKPTAADQVQRFAEGLAALMLPLMQGAAALAEKMIPIAEGMQQRARAWIEEEARKVGMTPEELLQSWAQTIERLNMPPKLPAYAGPVHEPIVYVPAPSRRQALLPEGGDAGAVDEQSAPPRRKIGFTVEE